MMETKSNENTSIWMKGISIALSIIMLFSAGYLSGGLTSTKAPEKPKGDETVEVGNPNTGSVPEPSKQEEPSTDAQTPSSDSDVPSSSEEEKPSDGGEKAPASDSKEKSKAEIIEIYNKGANAVKTDGAKVVRNYTDFKNHEEYLEVPSLAKSIINGAMSKYMVKDDKAVEYTDKQSIKDGFPVNGQDFASKLTDADVKDADLKDNGSEYEITLNLIDVENAKENEGIGSALQIYSVDMVNSYVGGIVKDMTTSHKDVVLKAKIDKNTGRMTYLNQYYLEIFKATAFGMNVAAGISFEYDYNVYY